MLLCIHYWSRFAVCQTPANILSCYSWKPLIEQTHSFLVHMNNLLGFVVIKIWVGTKYFDKINGGIFSN
jgi:hypothetical protein